MIPFKNTLVEENVESTSYTYNINKNTNRIDGFINNKEAIRQAIYLILSTERYESLIYSFNYGVELDSLIGENRAFVESELKRRIKEALLEDDRIFDVTNFKVEFKEDSAYIEFTVETVLGDVEIDWEVRR